jgi:hypothetical protein
MRDARPMVLRSLNLPAEMDEQLRNLAFVLRCPKADLIRYFVTRGLTEMIGRLGRKPTDDQIRQVATELQSNDSSVTELQARRLADSVQRAATQKSVPNKVPL